MAFREVHHMEVMEVVCRWQAGESQRRIAGATGLSRNAVEKYLRVAVEAGVSQGGEPPGDSVGAATRSAEREQRLRRQHRRQRAWSASGSA